MRRFPRLLLLICLFSVAGALGYKLVPDFEPVKMVLFTVVCLGLSEVLCQVDKLICKRCSGTAI